MAAPSNLVLQLLITAKDEASAAFGKLFGYLDDNTKVIAGKIREAFTNLFGGGIAGAAELEAQLDRVAAKGGYTAGEVNDLKKAAQQLGAQFGISGVEAAKGMESLAAAGLSASDAIATLPQVLALAASEQISADAAAQKLIDSLSIMGLGFGEAGRMADVLAKGANITTSSASQLAEALTQAGGMARAAGMDLESTVAALDLLHKNGIKGAEAGTALKSILTALLDPASKASEELSALGISSRDLGTVLAALKDKGGAASAAILAFGTEAGPGLRALINEGQSGLDEYTAQLKNAEGAAADAADQMGGNLQSALASLSSAWDSLKSALLDPLLPPITKQVKELAGAFQEGLSSDKFKAVQDTIKAFGESAATAMGDFVRSFDFQGALNSLADLAAGAKESFGGIAKAGSLAADTVIIAWNAVTAGFKTIGAAMVELTASVVATLATVEETASKIGLGSVERANALRQKALDMQETAKGLLSSVQQDAAELGAAFDRINEKAGETTQKIKEVTEAASIPPDALALEPIKKSLTDYQGLLERARTAQQDAAQAAREAEKDYIDVGLAMASGAVHASTWEAALKKDQAAQAALKAANENLTQASSEYNVALQEAIRSTNTESAAAEKSVKTKAQITEEAQKAAKAASQYATAVEGAATAQLAAKDADIALAEAKGETAKVQQLCAERAQLEADLSVKVTRAKAAEQQMEANLAVAKRDQVAALVAKNQATQEDLALAELVAQKELAEAQAAGVNAEAQAVLAAKLREVRDAKGGAAGAEDQHTEAVQRNSEAQRVNITHTKDTGQAAQGVANYLDQARKATDALSEATRQLFEAELGAALYSVGITDSYAAKRDAMIAYKDGVDAGRAALTAYQRELDNANQLIDQSQEKLLLAANGYRKWEAAIELATGKAKAAFYEEALAAENMRQGIERAMDNTAKFLEMTVASAESAVKGLRQLDDEDLAGLRSALDAANDKLRQMQEETQSAKDRLAELNADILQAQGQDQQAETLRQQLDYQQQLAEVEKQRAEAQLAGNRELLALLNEQELKLKTLNDLKLKNIQAEAKTEKPSASSSSASSTPTATPARSAVSGSYELKLSGAGKALTAYTDTDPSAFLSALENAQRVT